MKKTIRIQDRQGKVFEELEVEVPEGVSDEDLEEGISTVLNAHLKVLRTIMTKKSG